MKVDKRNCNKKYVMIVTSEDERYHRTVQLDFFADSPWQGRFECCIDGDNFRELSEEIEKADVEGLFYQLYENEDGNRIGYGTVDYDAIQDEIDEYEAKNMENIEALSYNVQYGDEILLTTPHLGYAGMCKYYFQQQILDCIFDENWNIKPGERRSVANKIVIEPVK